MGLVVVQRKLMFSVYSLAGEYFVIQNKNLAVRKLR